MQNQRRVIIENVLPQLDNGAFFIKRIVGQKVNVTADIISDGHDVMEEVVQYKYEKDKKWSEVRMNALPNDAFEATFSVEKQGYYSYFVEAWIDYALNWQYGIGKKINDNQHVKSELLEGVEYIKPLLSKVSASDKKYLNEVIDLFSNEANYDKAIIEAVSDKLKTIFKENPAKFLANQTKELRVYVDLSLIHI
jgi:starch synthase (maltosyl-transferring)